MAEAAGSAVCARLLTAVVSAAWRFAAVAAGVKPTLNWFGPGGADAVACSEMVWLVPSGKFKLNAIELPGFGLDAARLTESTSAGPTE